MKLWADRHIPTGARVIWNFYRTPHDIVHTSEVKICTFPHVLIWSFDRCKFVRYHTVEYGHVSDEKYYSVPFAQTHVTKESLKKLTCENAHCAFSQVSCTRVLLTRGTGQKNPGTSASVSTWVLFGKTFVQYSKCQFGHMWGKCFYSMKRQKLMTKHFKIDGVVHMNSRPRRGPHGSLLERLLQRGGMYCKCKRPMGCVIG